MLTKLLIRNLKKMQIKEHLFISKKKIYIFI